MKTFRAILLSLLVAVLVATSLAFVVLNAQPSSLGITKIADGPTPTPTQHFNSGGSGCHGDGC
jgi:Na+-transporting methylmalonyl-CoA/oxaloacetate decarboxylase beta subunit